jgi:hypothetical protein
MTWTPERLARLKVLWLQGWTCSQIAADLNKLPGPKMTRSAVIGKRSRLGLPGRASPVRPPKQRPVRAARAPVRVARVAVPKAAPMPWKRPEPPPRGEWNVRFIAREVDQCPMFIGEESGPDGLVCGRPIAAGTAWCSSCRSLAFQPLKLASAA